MKEDQYNTPRWIGCEVEHQYFGDERKEAKAARKHASAKDRSKYKKTDQRKEIDRSQELKKDQPYLKEGKVISITSGGIIVNIGTDTYACQLRGILKKEKTLSKNLITVGDNVLVELISDKEGAIAYVQPRRTLLSRAENLSRKKEQLIAANIDQVIIVVSVIAPVLKAPLIDRYIIATQKGGMDPIIVINKIDLLNDSTNDLDFIEKENQNYKEVVKAYSKIGLPMIGTSITTGEGIEELRQIMQNRTSVFSGQSGVGKSSLINIMTGGNLPIGDIVKKTSKGSHTTSVANLIPLESGGWCIDTPGIKSFGVWNLNKDEVKEYFPEIFSCGHNCRYPDCSHMHEEECAVHKAVNEGEISLLRYDSYIALMNSVTEDHLKR